MRTGGTVASLALGGCLALFSLSGPAFGQNTGDRDSDQRKPVPPPDIKPLPPNPRTPLPPRNPTPLPPVGGRQPTPTPAPEPAPSRDRNPQPGPPVGVDTRPPSDRDRTRENGDDDRRNHEDNDSDRSDRRRFRRPYPGYYDYWVYDRNRYYDDGYRPYDPQPPVDRYRDEGPAPEPAGGRAGPGAREGALLPPDDLMEDDQPPALRRALDASPQYREATAQLLRAWADYARAAEQVLQRLRLNARYQRAMSDLREAEAKAAALRDRGGNVPAVNLVSAAQEAMLARRAVRRLEEQAIDADPVARRAKQQVDQAVERRKKIRDDLAAKLPPQPGQPAQDRQPGL